MLLIVILLVGFVYGNNIEIFKAKPNAIIENSTDNNLGVCYGEDTTWNEYPYLVALRNSGGGACCTGSILSLNPGRILTAAHCLPGCIGDAYVGCNNPANCDGDAYPVTSYILHPQWNGNVGAGYDVAVIFLSSPITTPGAMEIQIPATQFSPTTVRFSGYGRANGGVIPTSVQTALGQSLTLQQCQTEMNRVLNPTIICYRGGEQGQNQVPIPCSGDSGSPIIDETTGLQIAVHSFGVSGNCNDACTCTTCIPRAGANTVTLRAFIEQYQTLDNISVNKGNVTLK